MQSLETKIPPPLVAMIFGIAMWVTAHLVPKIYFPGRLGFAIAIACGAFGVTVAGLGMRAFRKAKTTINPVNPEQASSVVTSGIYRYTRNPMYVGLTAALVSLAIGLSAPWTLLGAVGFVLFTRRFQIIPEERVMSLKFGQEYDQYRRRVRRWL
jgi:protein-S-isoprenylcysteine O-methyltransferase Ste14